MWKIKSPRHLRRPEGTMNNRINLIKISMCIWVGLIAFPILGLLTQGLDGPGIEMECPQRVWDMIENDPPLIEKIRWSEETMRSYGCKLVLPEEEPFSPTNWMLFGAATGFAIGVLIPGGESKQPMQTSQAKKTCATCGATSGVAAKTCHQCGKKFPPWLERPEETESTPTQPPSTGSEPD